MTKLKLYTFKVTIEKTYTQAIYAENKKEAIDKFLINRSSYYYKKEKMSKWSLLSIKFFK